MTITRANGFTGPVMLSLPLPPGVTGLAAPEVAIPADKNEGTLVVQAAADATMGQLVNMVVRASINQRSGRHRPASGDQRYAVKSFRRFVE